MLRQGRRALAPAAGIILLASWGCDGGGSAPSVTTSKEQATVTGTVTIKGKPMASGQIVFDAANYLRKDIGSTKAEIGKDGTYTAKAYLGENHVTVMGSALKTQDLTYNETILDVKAGENKHDVALPNKPAPAKP